jgi:hypothetical protein
MSRENKDQLIDEPGQAMNEGNLNRLNDAYASVRDEFASRFNAFEIVNTSGSEKSSPQSTAYEVTAQILNLFRVHQKGRD